MAWTGGVESYFRNQKKKKIVHFSSMRPFCTLDRSVGGLGGRARFSREGDVVYVRGGMGTWQGDMRPGLRRLAGCVKRG